MTDQYKHKIGRRLAVIQSRKKELVSEINRDQHLIEVLLGSNLNLLPSIQYENDLRTPNKMPSYKHLQNGLEAKSSHLSFKEYLKVRDESCDLYFYDNIKSLLNKIPDSNGSRFFERKNVHIGIVADEFLFHSFKDVAYFHYITPENFEQYAGKLDIFIVVTAWRGLNEEWRGLANPKGREKRNKLYAIIDTYRKHGTRIVFYSKEDPANYEVFIDIARHCDYVLTTEKSKVNDYRRDCGHDRVSVMRFGVNPIYHNPIGMRNAFKRNEVLFAGSWYKKYPERQIDTQMIFDGIIESGAGLKIIDRNFYYVKSNYYAFPLKYVNFISPTIPHEDLQKVHKLFNWAINLNSIKFSETMFANRVYELQALGNLVISNYSSAVNNLFPNVFLVHNKEEVAHILNSMSEEDIYRHQTLGIRKVMSGETTFHRIEDMLIWLGMGSKAKRRKVAVLVDQKTESIIQSFDKQSYPDKELLLLSEWKEELRDHYDMVTFFHPEHVYEEFYLEDMINGFKYTSCDYITKDAYFSGKQYNKGVEHNYVNQIKSKYRTVFWTEAFDVKELIATDGPLDRGNGYSIDPFEFNEQSIKIETSSNPSPLLSVIVPIYNNGEQLISKCFNSLKRSSIFNRMEILLIDDGSTDHITTRIVERLERYYPNVKAYFFPKGGSGSASRARNKGMELANAEFITFLDPDNEAVNDGYARLVEEISNNDYDMVIGNMLKLDHQKSLFDFYDTTISINKSDVITDTRQFLVNTDMKAQSIQALVVKKNIIADNHLQMVLNAAGQDTLFFQQMFLQSSRVKVIDTVIHLYYAAVIGSVTNTITKQFFEKYLILEKARFEFLTNNNLLETYMKKRFSYYFNNWYLKKLRGLDKVDANESVNILYQIYSIYKPYITKKDKKIQQFERFYKEGRVDKILGLAS